MFKGWAERISFLIGSVVLVGSIVLAISIHPARIRCSSIGGISPAECPQPGTPMAVKIGIVVAGLAVATTTVVLTRIWKARRSVGP